MNRLFKLSLLTLLTGFVSTVIGVFGRSQIPFHASYSAQFDHLSQVQTSNLAAYAFRHSFHGSQIQLISDLGPRDDRYDLRAIDTLILHHEGAIGMAHHAKERSQNHEIQALAQQMLEEHQQQRSQLQQWRQSWYQAAPNIPIGWSTALEQPSAMSIEQMKKIQMVQDLNVALHHYDRHFLTAMLHHHQGGLYLKHQILNKVQRPTLQHYLQTALDATLQEVHNLQGQV